MKKIKFLFIQLILLSPLIPLVTNALKTVNNYEDSVSGFSAVEFKTPVLTVLNVSAFVVLIFSIIKFMKGYTEYDLASGNFKDLASGKKQMMDAGIGFIYTLIVFIVDMSVS